MESPGAATRDGGDMSEVTVGERFTGAGAARGQALPPQAAEAAPTLCGGRKQASA